MYMYSIVYYGILNNTKKQDYSTCPMPPMLPMRPLSSIAPKGGTKLRAEAITWLHAQVGGANGQAQIFPAIHLDTIHCIQIKLYSIHL